MQLNFQEVLKRLAPSYPTPIIGITLYVIMILAIITLFLQKKSNLQITIMIALTVMCALIEKIDAWRSFAGADTQFVALMLRIVIFVLPLVCAGMTKWEKSRPPAILAGVIAGVYLFARWFFEQRPA
ncbi:MAG: hypothetical protein IT324_07625 [Anaerolineae bacterium]|nr:hypothetical protein [Anaerolineae bacterium]